jgi:hypothetical protein
VAIAFDAESHPGSYAQNNSWTHTVGAISSGIAIVLAGTHSDTPAPSTITFGGSNMTLLGDFSGSYRRTCVYYLLNPSTGDNAVVVNWAGAVAYSCRVTCLTYAGVLQADTFRTYSGQSATTSPINKTISSAVDDVVVDVIAAWGDGLACDVGQTERYISNNALGFSMGASEKAGASSVTTTWTKSGTGDAYHAIYSFSMKPTDDERTISEDFTVNAAMDAWKTPDELAEGFTINATMKAGFETEGTLSEDLTVNAAMSADKETGAPIFEDLTVNASMDAIATYNRGLAASASVADSIDALATYNRGLASTVNLGAAMDAEFKWPVKRQVFPYRAQGKRLSIRIGCAQKGSWIRLLDISTTVLPMVGRTRSQAVKLKGIGNHIGVKIGNTDGGTLKLAYAGLQIERPIGR